MTALRKIEVVEADITTLAVEAVVNAANEKLVPGGGVCGAIHRVAGPLLAEECARLGGCATGDAKITAGYELPARYVIHAVGPVWKGGGRGEADLLAACYRRSLELAEEAGAASIAFPALSTGIFGYPADEAARVAVAAVIETLPATPGIERVILCCFDAASAERHRRALAEACR